MAVADLDLPTRLLAGGGPGTPYPTVLRALTTPVVGQFDPEFTRLMDEVVAMAREALKTHNPRCLAVAGLASAGVEALLNTLLEPGERVAIAGGPRFVSEVAAIARRYGAQVEPFDAASEAPGLVVAPLVDPDTLQVLPVAELARVVHASGRHLVVDATLGFAGVDLRVDAWGIDACLAGADYCLGAPAGMALVTWSEALERRMQARQSVPRTSYLDLRQLAAYWSPERLNHHTAPTSLVYGLHAALRRLLELGLDASVVRHQAVGRALHDGLAELGFDVSGDAPYALAQLPPALHEPALRAALHEQHGIFVRLSAPGTWQMGLLAADATPPNARRVLLAITDASRAR